MDKTITKLNNVDWDTLGTDITDLSAQISLINANVNTLIHCPSQSEPQAGAGAGDGPSRSLVDSMQAVVIDWSEVFDGKCELSNLLDSVFALTIAQVGYNH